MAGSVYVYLSSFGVTGSFYGNGETINTVLDMTNGHYRFLSGASPEETATYAQLTSVNGFDTSTFTVNVKWLPNNDIVYTAYHTPLPRSLGSRIETTRVTFNLDDVLAGVITEPNIPANFVRVTSNDSNTYGVFDYSAVPSGNIVNGDTYGSDYEFVFRTSVNDANYMKFAVGLGSVYTEAEPEAEGEAEAEPGPEDVTLYSFPMALPSFVINHYPNDYIDFVFTFSDIPVSNFYPTTLSNTSTRYTLSQWPLVPNGSYSLSVRATYTKDSGGVGGGASGGSGVSGKVYHDPAPEGPLLFLNGGSLTTDLSLLQDKGSFNYTEIPASFYSGNTVPANSLGYDNDLYVNYSTMILYLRVSGAWVAQGSFLQNNIMFSGSGAPGSSVGYDGSFYFDVVSSTVYGPKASGSWVGAATYSLRRAALLSGTQAALNNTVGFSGDFYYATDTKTLFGPKTVSGWDLSAGIALTGGAFYSGTGVPAGSLGLIGDSYLDRSTGILYGPKTSDTAWTGATTSSLFRAAFLSGTFAGMTSGVGLDGDFYFATDTGFLYGPKTGGAWSTSTGMMIRGGNLLFGSGAPANSLGNNGDSYIDTVTGTLYLGKASGSWTGSGVTNINLMRAALLNGTDANLATNGATIGVNGDFYYATDTGYLYGPKSGGAWNLSTRIALSGGRFYSGSGAPAGSVGGIGDTYLDIVSGRLYGPKTTSGSWTGVTQTSLFQSGWSSGSGPPTDGSVTGAVTGGFYLDTVTKELYGPYNGTTWTGVAKVASFSGALLFGSTGGSPPASSVGVQGDFFYDIISGLMFGPRTSSGWSSSDSIRIRSEGATLSGTGTSGLISSYGRIGDLYLDVTTGMLYGPKTSSGWDLNQRFALSGGRFHTGTVAPSGSVGLMGDFYFNQTTGMMYGPKLTSGSWSGAATFSLSRPGILSGSGAPAESVGLEGEFYYSRSENLLYGPKTGTWANSPKLRTNLSGFLSGTANPLDSDGRVGDVYFNISTNELWGPKTTDGWGSSGVSLGSTGETEDSLITGNGPPSLDAGAIGSVYIDRTNLRIYGPKTLTSAGTFTWPIIGGLTPVSGSGSGSGSGGCGCGSHTTPSPCSTPCSSPCNSSAVSNACGGFGARIGSFIGSVVSEFFTNPLLFLSLLIILGLLFVLWKNRCRTC